MKLYVGSSWCQVERTNEISCQLSVVCSDCFRSALPTYFIAKLWWNWVVEIVVELLLLQVQPDCRVLHKKGDCSDFSSLNRAIL